MVRARAHTAIIERQTHTHYVTKEAAQAAAELRAGGWTVEVASEPTNKAGWFLRSTSTA
jgi:hypothetical protein